MYGEIENKKINLEFIPLDEEGFREEIIDVTNIQSKEELIEYMNTIKSKKFIKAILAGERNCEFDEKEILSIIENDYILKIKNKTILPIDYNELSQEASLRGIFVKECLLKLEEATSEEEKEKIKKAMEIGISCM